MVGGELGVLDDYLSLAVYDVVSGARANMEQRGMAQPRPQADVRWTGNGRRLSEGAMIYHQANGVTVEDDPAAAPAYGEALITLRNGESFTVGPISGRELLIGLLKWQLVQLEQTDKWRMRAALDDALIALEKSR